MSDDMSPGEVIREELKKRGWGQEDLSRVMQRPLGRVNEIIQGKQAITAEIAVDLADALGNDPETWMRLEADYRLSQITSESSEIRTRARIFELGPIKEMIRRGWIAVEDSTESLERALMDYYGLQSIHDTPSIHGAMRKTNQELPASPPQTAWAFRVRHLASAIPASAVNKYDETRVDECKRELRKLAAYSAEVRKVPALLMSYGIRFVVVEGLNSAKMDGFATWLDDESPVIGMSLKFDRLDSFWFTLGHEITHIKYRDVAPIDGNVGGHDELPLDVKPPMERRADDEGAAMFVSPDELDSFIKRVGPVYSAERINQFANSIKMHPRIIIGQLRHRGQIGYSQHTKPAVPVRDVVVKTAIVDGWGKTIQLGALK
jgi:HTH-type transcriptional regulator/antitoxin HigA